MENLSIGIKLMCIGMPTVFAVLALIVFAGFLLQRHLIPTLEKRMPGENIPSDKKTKRESGDIVPDPVAEAITKAIGVASKGRYGVLKIMRK